MGKQQRKTQKRLGRRQGGYDKQTNGVVMSNTHKPGSQNRNKK